MLYDFRVEIVSLFGEKKMKAIQVDCHWNGNNYWISITSAKKQHGFFMRKHTRMMMGGGEAEFYSFSGYLQLKMIYLYIYACTYIHTYICIRAFCLCGFVSEWLVE